MMSTHGATLSSRWHVLTVTKGSPPSSEMSVISENPTGPSISPVLSFWPFSPCRISRTCAALAPPNFATPPTISLFSKSILFMPAEYYIIILLKNGRNVWYNIPRNQQKKGNDK